MNAKMKVLSLALVGLCGFAGSAMAACPAGPTTANGGAWSALNQFQGVASIATPGYDGTECRLDSKINTGAPTAAFATVQDDSPANEARYRAQFLINLDGLTSPTANTAVNVFSANSSTNGPGIQLSVFGTAGSWFLGYIVKNASSASGVTVGSVPLTAGANRVEFDLQIGSAGSVAFWVNNTNAATPTVPAVALNNQAVGGIDLANLGLAGPTKGFINTFGGKAVGFDQFDSRRQTFIGH